MKRWLAMIPGLSLITFLAGVGFFISILVEGEYKVSRDGDSAVRALILAGICLVLAVLSGPPISPPRHAIYLRRRVLVLASFLLALAILLYCSFSGQRGLYALFREATIRRFRYNDRTRSYPSSVGRAESSKPDTLVGGNVGLRGLSPTYKIDL